MKKKVTVAIDGPSSSGKSTIAKLVAKHFNFTYIDSGSIYRAITYVALKNNPLPWTTHWLNSKDMQVAPQETEVESYVIGGIKQDVKKDTFSGFKL